MRINVTSRNGWYRLLLREDDSFKVAKSFMGKIGKWKPNWTVGGLEDYRTILQNEIVFDIDETDWKRVRLYANMIRSGMRQFGIHPIMAYSGGKGVHIHMFIDKDRPSGILKFIGWENYRKLVAYTLLLSSGFGKEEITSYKAGIDPRKIAPRPGTSMIRSFGAKKNGVKTMITAVPMRRGGDGSNVYPHRIEPWNPLRYEIILLEALKDMPVWKQDVVRDMITFKLHDCVTCTAELTTYSLFPSDQCGMCTFLRHRSLKTLCEKYIYDRGQLRK